MNVTGVPSFARMSSAVINNKIYTFGGYDGQCKLFELSVFDPSLFLFFKTKENLTSLTFFKFIKLN